MSDFEYGCWLVPLLIVLVALLALFAYENNWYGIPAAWKSLRHRVSVYRKAKRLSKAEAPCDSH